MFATYLAYEYHFAAAQLILAMLGMGATLRAADFTELAREPGAMIAGLVAQLLLVPIVALALSRFAPVDAGIAVGLALVAAVPGGSLSNIITYLAGANAPLSIALTGVSTAACLVTTPLWLRLLWFGALPDDFRMPAGRIAIEIAGCLLAPLLAGMLVAARRPRQAARLAHYGIRGSLLVILAMAVGSAGAGRIDAAAYGWAGPLAIVGFSVLAQQAAMLLGRLARLPDRDRLTIGIEVTVRNTNLALLIKASLLPAVAGVPDPIADGAFFVALLYGGVALLVALPACALHRLTAIPPAPAAEPSTAPDQ